MALTERLAVIIDAKTDGFVREIRKAGTAAKTGLDDRPLGKFGAKLEGLGVSAGAAKAGLYAAAAAGVAFVGTKLVKFAGDSVDAFASLGSKIREFQRVSGAGAEVSSKFVYALEKLGVGTEAGATGLFMLGKKLGSGKLDLERWGTEVARTAEGGVDLTGTVLNIADSFTQIKDPAQRAALAAEAFGRSGKNLIPVLAKGREGIKALFDEAGRTNQILSQDDLDRAKEFTLAQKELANTFQGLKVKAGNALTPVVTDLTKMLTSIIQIGDALGAFEAMGTVIRGALGPLTNMVDLYKSMTDELGITSTSTDKYGIAQKELAEKQSEYNSLVVEGNGQTKEAKKLRREIIDISGALGDVESTLAENLQTTAEKAAEAERALSSLKTTLFGYGDSQRGAQAALLAYQDAQAGVADSVDRLNQAKLAGRQIDESEEQFSRRIAGLQRDVQSAYLATADAHDRVAQAAVEALTTEKNLQAAASDPTARRALVRQLEEAKTKYGDTTGAIQAQIDTLRLYDQTNPRAKRLDVDTTQGRAAIDDIQFRLDAVHDKTIRLTVISRMDDDPTVSLPTGGGTGRRAKGGPVRPDRRYLVGEEGPEIFEPKVAGRVLSNRESMARLREIQAPSNGGTSSSAVYNITVQSVSPSAQVGRDVVAAIQAHERSSGARWRR